MTARRQPVTLPRREPRQSVFWYWSGANQSPLVTSAFLARQRQILLPAQFAREHENAWVDGADALVTAAEVDDGMDGSWIESPTGAPGRSYVFAVDLGAVHDPTAIAIGHEEDALVCVDRIITLQGSHEHPVQIATVEQVIRDLADSFPPCRVLIESWQGLGAAQSLTRAGLPAEIVTPTLRRNSEEWGLLAQLFAARRVVLPVHPRLREELLGLSYEVGPTGIRVTDRRAIHQDHAVVVRMLAAVLAQPRSPAMVW